MLFTYTEYITR